MLRGYLECILRASLEHMYNLHALRGPIPQLFVLVLQPSRVCDSKAEPEDSWPEVP